MDISSLSPEERAQLKAALDAPVAAPAGDGFQKAIIGVLEQIAAAIDSLDKRVAAAEERGGKLESLVMDEIIGGIKSLYDDNMRSEGITGLKDKYKQFEPLAPDFQELTQSDLWSELYDTLQGVGDGEREPLAGQIFDGLKGKFDKIKGVSPASAVEVAIKKESTPEGEKPPEVKAVEAAPEEDPLKAVVDSVKRMKRGRRGSGIVPGAMRE